MFLICDHDYKRSCTERKYDKPIDIINRYVNINTSSVFYILFKVCEGYLH